MGSFAQRLSASPAKKLARRAARRAPGAFEAKRLAPSHQPATKVQFDFAKIRLHAPAAAKLEVGSASDTHEREADRVSKETISRPERVDGSAAGIGPARSQLTRTDASASPLAPAVDIEPELQRPGQALEPHTRACMESSFGHDFSKVRVHTDAAAAASAGSLNARAYTFGRDIFFAKQEYAPTVAGRKLLAHELAHVVQQSVGEPVIQCGPGPGKDQPAQSTAAKEGNRLSTLRAKSGEIQSKLQNFSEMKQWRGQFHASTDETFRQISELTRRYHEAEQEWQKIESETYLFERESSRGIPDRLNRAWTDLANVYWTTRRTSDAEQAYESESRKQELDLLKQQAAIAAEIGELGKSKSPISQSQYDSLLARLNQLNAAVDRLWDAEMQAQAKYTQSGPVSTAGKPAR